MSWTWRDRDNAEQNKPFVEHLDDLRLTIIRSLILLGLGLAIALPLAPYVLDLAKRPLLRIGLDPDSFLRVFRVAGGLTVAMRIVFWTGLLISLPFILLVVGQFVLPGLTAKERQGLLRASGFAVLLFAIGVGLGYGITLPLAVEMILRVNTWLGVASEFVELADYISFVLRLLLAFGLAFEMPVLIVLLGRWGILTSGQLRGRRSEVIVGILVVAMLLTPPDPITQVVMALPLVLLYEMCVWIVWMGEKVKRGREQTASA